jgi:hypothetical protein
MSNPIIRIHDTSSIEVIDREMTDTEYAEHKAAQASEKAKAKAETDKATTKQAVLDRLGITADEAALLLG